MEDNGQEYDGCKSRKARDTGLSAGVAIVAALVFIAILLLVEIVSQ